MRSLWWIAASLLLTVAGLWFALVRAPSPAQVCDHIIAVTLEEAGEQALPPESKDHLIETLRTRCIAHKHDKLQLRGRIDYARYAKCIMNGDSLRAIEDC